jgi:nicotinamide riboside transporter PnuC
MDPNQKHREVVDMTRKANGFVMILIVLAVVAALYGLYRWNSTINWQAHQNEGQSGLVALGFLLCCAATWVGTGLLACRLEGSSKSVTKTMMLFGLFSLAMVLGHAFWTGFYDEIYPAPNGNTPPL